MENESLKKIIEELNQKNASLQQEIVDLQNQIESIRHLEHVAKYNVQKSKESFEVATHNAGIIIMKAVDFSYAFKEEIAKLLDRIDNYRYDPQKVLKAIDEFLEYNKKIYSFNRKDSDRITELIKNEILVKMK